MIYSSKHWWMHLRTAGVVYVWSYGQFLELSETEFKSAKSENGMSRVGPVFDLVCYIKSKQDKFKLEFIWNTLK